MSEEPLISQSLIDSINSCLPRERVVRPIPNCDNYFASDDGWIWYTAPADQDYIRLEHGWHEDALVCIVNGRLQKVLDLVLSAFYPGIYFEVWFKDNNPANCALSNLTLKHRTFDDNNLPPATVKKPQPQPEPEPDIDVLWLRGEGINYSND